MIEVHADTAGVSTSCIYWIFSGAGNKKLLRIKFLVASCLLPHFRLKEINKRKHNIDFWLSNSNFNRYICCCKLHKREKQFDLRSLSLKSAYLNLIFYLSLLVVKSEFGMKLRDYKKQRKNNPKQEPGKAKTL